MITKDSYEGELKKFRKYCRKHPNELGCYVYALADPTKGKEQLFYVGKGQKERMFNHILSSFKHNIGATIQPVRFWVYGGLLY